jgi:leader peptidase (prepilin peptidase)/N-methyltransferase
VIVGLVSGVAGGVAFAGETSIGTALVWWLALVPGVAAAAVDLHEHRIPNRILIIMIAAMAAVMLVEAIATGSWWILGRATLAGAGGFALFYLFAMLTGLGYGDVKLVGLLSAAAGYQSVQAIVSTLMLGWLLAGLLGLMLLGVRRRDDPLPLGPSLLAGAGLGLALLAAAG